MLSIAHTADLDDATLDAVRSLLESVFADDWTAHDWDHALGGVHAIVSEGDGIVAHAAVVQRRVLHGGRALRTGYVEGVAVRPDRRRRGHAATLMEAIERVIRGAYDLGALSATDAAARLYAGRGWRRWEGPTYALTPDGLRRTEQDDGGVYVFDVSVPVDAAGDLACDWRDGEVW